MAGGPAVLLERAIPRMAKDERLRFLCGKIDIPKNITECWVWNAPASTGRYGLFRLRGDKYLPHRVMWTLCYKEIPAGMHVLHRCDRPRCVNPYHLFLGTHTDNMRDKVAKGRCGTAPLRGEKANGSKLTPEKVLAIREDPRFQRDIAADYGVDQSTICDIKARATWAHL